MMKSECSTVPASNSSGKLEDVGDVGWLRCLHGEVDTTVSYYVYM